VRDPLVEREGQGLADRPEQYDSDPVNPHRLPRNLPNQR
jgi:hypothetical protein